MAPPFSTTALAAAVGEPSALAIAGWVIALAANLFLLGAFLYVVYCFVSLPWRRREQAAIVLDLLEMGLSDGKSPEAALAEIYDTPTADFPIQLHKLAAHLKTGLTLSEALQKVPEVLPRPVLALLLKGLGRVEPLRLVRACRDCLGAPVDSRQGILFLLLVVTTQFMGAGCGFAVFMKNRIVPSLEEVLGDAMGSVATISAPLLFAGSFWVVLGLYVGVSLLILGTVFRRLSGASRLEKAVGPYIDVLVPWQRERVRANFASALALYLDAGFSEEDALLSAAGSTGNKRWESRSLQAVARLQQGEPFQRVLTSLDEAGEFQWRLRHAFHGIAGTGGGPARFHAVLQGWTDFLRLRADQLEIKATQLLLVFFTLTLGLLVGLICGWLFRLLNLISEAFS